MRIGVFDSGIGGLTVLREVRRQCPGHSTLYLGDTARVPYGSKSPQTIQRYALGNADFLQREGIDALIVACNTASAYGLDALHDLPIPVAGVIEPGAALAAARTRTGRVGILGTAGTIRSGAYEAALKRINPKIEAVSIACPLFVPLVEEGWHNGPIARSIIEKYLAPWIENPATRPDTVILGCTHYPLLKHAIGEVLGDGVELIDSAEAVAARLRESLAGEPDEDHPEHRLFLTDASEVFVQIAGRFFGGLQLPPAEVVDIDPAALNPAS